MPDQTLLPSVGLRPTNPTVDIHAADVNPGVTASAEGRRERIFPIAKNLSDIMLAQTYRESTARAQDIINQATYATGELANEFETLEQSAAIEAAPEYVKRLKEINHNAIEGTNKDDAVVRRMVKDNLNALMLQTGLKFDAHRITETKKYEQTTLIAARQNAYEQAGRVYGSDQAKLFQQQAQDYEKQRLLAAGIAEGSEAWNRSLLEVDSAYHYDNIAWHIREGRLGQARRYMEQYGRNMTREDYHRLHIEYSNAVEAEAAKARAAANKQPLDYYAIYNKFYQEALADPENAYIEEEVRVPLPAKQQGTTSTALKTAAAAALPPSLTGGQRVEVDNDGTAYKIEKHRRKRTDQELAATARDVAMQRFASFSNYVTTRSQADAVALHQINESVQQMLQQNGGQYISPFSQEGSTYFNYLVQVNNGDVPKAQRQWENMQGLGTGNKALTNSLNTLLSSPEDLLQSFPTLESLTQFCITHGASQQDLADIQQRYQLAKNKQERGEIDAQTSFLKNALIQAGIGLDKNSWKLGNSNFAFATEAVQIAKDIFMSLPPEQRNAQGFTNALRLPSNIERLRAAKENADETRKRLRSLDLDTHAQRVYVAAIQDGRTEEDAMRIAENEDDPERYLYDFETNSALNDPSAALVYGLFN